jgi:hypothetical protein
MISIGQLCDDNCVALFTRYNVKLYKDGNIIILGERNKNNGLWTIPLAPQAATLPPLMRHTPLSPASHSAKGAIRHARTKEDLAVFLHACAFSPLPSSFLRAFTRGHFSYWPGLTPAFITKHLPNSLAFSMGHLRMQQKNIQSTKPITTDLPLATSLDVSPSQEPNNVCTSIAFANILPATELHKSYSNQTGNSPSSPHTVTTTGMP